jgi:hypothetical protein
MGKTAFLGSLALALLAGAASAQEPPPPADEHGLAQDERAYDDQGAYDEARAPQPVLQIRVLENPYDLASFYRSSQGGNFLDYRPEGASSADRYPIASYYRQQGSGYRSGYAPFWTNGYGYGDGYASARSGLTLTYRQRIGENGDLFLFAPFLSPIGPLTDAFFGQ